MKSALELYNDTAKQFRLGDKKQLHVRQKLAFVEEQLQAMQMTSHRLLCDVVVTKLALDQAKDDNTKAAIQNKLAGYENDLRQISMGMDHYLELQGAFNTEFKQSGEEA